MFWVLAGYQNVLTKEADNEKFSASRGLGSGRDGSDGGHRLVYHAFVDVAEVKERL
jgi:hypothetical protein